MHIYNFVDKFPMRIPIDPSIDIFLDSVFWSLGKRCDRLRGCIAEKGIPSLGCVD
jgi:hypothetical protein